MTIKKVSFKTNKANSPKFSKFSLISNFIKAVKSKQSSSLIRFKKFEEFLAKALKSLFKFKSSVREDQSVKSSKIESVVDDEHKILQNNLERFVEVEGTKKKEFLIKQQTKTNENAMNESIEDSGEITWNGVNDNDEDTFIEEGSGPTTSLFGISNDIEDKITWNRVNDNDEDTFIEEGSGPTTSLFGISNDIEDKITWNRVNDNDEDTFIEEGSGPTTRLFGISNDNESIEDSVEITWNESNNNDEDMCTEEDSGPTTFMEMPENNIPVEPEKSLGSAALSLPKKKFPKTPEKTVISFDGVNIANLNANEVYELTQKCPVIPNDMEIIMAKYLAKDMYNRCKKKMMSSIGQNFKFKSIQKRFNKFMKPLIEREKLDNMLELLPEEYPEWKIYINKEMIIDQMNRLYSAEKQLLESKNEKYGIYAKLKVLQASLQRDKKAKKTSSEHVEQGLRTSHDK